MSEPASIAVGCDHGGFRLKEAVLEEIADLGYLLKDLGTDSADSVDYPDFAHPVAELVASGQVALGILICGTGIGMSIAANKHPGIRASLCGDTFSARMTRAHNDANILCLGERVIGPGLARDIVRAFLTTEFEGGRHSRRVQKIEPIEGAS
jgi:ribose 5-phosphate isomerase B